VDVRLVSDAEEDLLLQQARAGDQASLARLFERHRPRLLLMIRARMNPRLRRRLDDCDVLQDALVEAVRRLPDYLRQPRAPFFLWVRKIVHLKILEVHRQHMAHQARDLRREVHGYRCDTAPASSIGLVDEILGKLTSPSMVAARDELKLKLHEALDQMGEIDREILSLRHFEELDNHEAAAELGIEPSAASKRYVRALLRFEAMLTDLGLDPDASSAALRPREMRDGLG
jgi:RNA polymerase sigma-70 factor (ECF subfamily)